MRLWTWSWTAVVVALAAGNVAAQDEAEPTTAPTVNSCLTCHADSTLMVGEMEHLLVTESDLADDLHWQQGLRCHDCHGGDASVVDFRKAHFKESGFRSIKSPADIPSFCGHCHSDPVFMRNYDPTPRTDQEALYWTSGHGRKLKESGDEKVANCVSCHGSHNVRPVKDLSSPVYPTNVATTCGSCHSDSEWMAGRMYGDRPIGNDQVELWSKSIHGNAMLELDDLSAPTCNDCHGNHGALPPQVGAVGNVCGSCHVKIGELFANTLMKHSFEEVDLPGCATCHGHHDVHAPSDDMLGMEAGAVCASCHNKGGYGATFIGAEVAKEMRSGLEKLKEQIATVSEELEHAERLGMEVRDPSFRLREATDALENSRTLVHSFAIEPMKEALDEGLSITEECGQKADEAIQEYTTRRIWLAASMLPILLVIGVLLLYIRSLPEHVEPMGPH